MTLYIEIKVIFVLSVQNLTMERYLEEILIRGWIRHWIRCLLPMATAASRAVFQNTRAEPIYRLTPSHVTKPAPFSAPRTISCTGKFWERIETLWVTFFFQKFVANRSGQTTSSFDTIYVSRIKFRSFYQSGKISMTSFSSGYLLSSHGRNRLVRPPPKQIKFVAKTSGLGRTISCI